MDKIKVLIVDDSIFSREIIKRGICSDPMIEVVATAKDPFEAGDKILQFKPDVMTCDVEMPKMNGIEFVKRLIPQYPIPVIMVSSLSGAVFDAMNAGAVDFVVKPDSKSVTSVENFIEEMITKIKIASRSKIVKLSPQKLQERSAEPVRNSVGLIAIGASTGGTEAIHNTLTALPRSMPGIVIVQHIPPVFSRMFAERLNKATEFDVKEASTGDFVVSGQVLLAPGNMHMSIKKVGDKYKVQCFDGEKVNGHRPSVDVLFDSVAKEAGSDAIGVILTGMGYDGAKGMLAMRRKGARTIGQDEKSCVVYGMPKVAFEIGAVEKQVPLASIPRMLRSMI